MVIPPSIQKKFQQNSITQAMYITDIGYYPKAAYHYCEREKGIAQHVLIYCESGSGWISLHGQKHILNNQEAFILPPNTPHAYGADINNPWSIYWLHFNGTRTNLFNSIIGCVIRINLSDKNRYNERIQLFEEMYKNLETNFQVENIEYVSFCLMHFLASLKYIKQFREINKAESSDVIHSSIDFMKDHLEDSLTLNEIAEHAHYSPSHFSNLFLKKTGYSPMKYYNTMKIQSACSYLASSDLKIKEIAFRLGFYDPFHFSKTFHKETGMSPEQYRETHVTALETPTTDS